MQLHDSLRMGRRIGMQAAEEAELIDCSGEMREELGDPRPGFAVLCEFESRGSQSPPPGPTFPSLCCKLRLVLPCIELRGGPFHEQENDPLGFRAEVGQFCRQRFCRGVLPERSHAFRGALAQQTGQRDEPKPAPAVLKRLPSRKTWLSSSAGL